jgi:hypothetical protein
MSESNTALGPDARVFINGIAYAVIEGRYTDMADVSETTDSLSGGSKEAASGNRQFTCDITAQRIDSVLAVPPPFSSGSLAQVNFYNGPLFLFPGSYVSVTLRLDGINLNSGVYIIGNFLIEELEGNWRVQGSEPQTIRFRGRSSGPFTTPDGSFPEAGVRNSDNF